jgi:uncharacterized membrane protein YdbT with pleckstrin-like domain
MDEQRDTFRSSTLGWLRGTLAGWGTLLLGLGGFAAALAGAGGVLPGVGAWPLLLAGISLVIILAVWIRNLAATYEITPDRLIIRRGIFIKSIDEIELYRIKDVRIDFSLINQWAGIGTITISSSDETTRSGDLVLPYVDRAQARREELRRLVDAARQRRRVREIDMVHEDI